MYSGKLFWAVQDLVRKGFFEKGSKGAGSSTGRLRSVYLSFALKSNGFLQDRVRTLIFAALQRWSFLLFEASQWEALFAEQLLLNAMELIDLFII